MVANMERMTEEELETFMSEGPISGWSVFEKDDGSEVNVIPENDLRMHLYGTLCRCRPSKEVTDEGVPLYVHNSYDGREAYENGKKPH